MWEKKSSTDLRPVLQECRGEGIFYLILNFKYFINAVKFRCVAPLIFCCNPVALMKHGVTAWGVIEPTLKTRGLAKTAAVQLT